MRWRGHGKEEEGRLRSCGSVLYLSDHHIGGMTARGVVRRHQHFNQLLNHLDLRRMGCMMAALDMDVEA